MKGRIASALAVSLLVLLIAGAPASGERQHGMMMMKKHVTLVDVYLENAVNDAKALAMFADMEIGAQDLALVKEVQKNLHMSIDRAHMHLGRFGKMHEPVSSELATHLEQARAAAKKLEGVKVGNLAERVEPIVTHLTAARTSFRELAKQMNYTMIGETELQMAPVRGKETEEKKMPPEPLPEPARPEAPPNY